MITTIGMWMARSFTAPSDLNAIEIAATAASLLWGVSMLVGIRWLGGAEASPSQDDERYDEAA